MSVPQPGIETHILQSPPYEHDVPGVSAKTGNDGGDSKSTGLMLPSQSTFPWPNPLFAHETTLQGS